MSQPFRLPCAALALALLLPGCGDNPTCIFTTGCNGGEVPLSENDARAPVAGEWLVDGQPEVTDAFPSGPQQAPTTPIVLFFSESMQAESLDGTFELVPILASGLPGPAVPGVSSALVSDGRVLIFFPPPPTGLTAGEYRLRRTSSDEEEAPVPLDLTGQTLALDSGETVTTFTVASSPPAAPKVVAIYPPDDAEAQAATTEIVVVFDRAVLQSSVDDGTFQVEVNDAPPAQDPLATPVLARLGANQVTDTRAFTWRSVDAEGVAVPLGTDANVELLLSPNGDPIREQDGGILPLTQSRFQTLRFAPPLSATILSQPSDAIGLANLTDGDPEELVIELELDDLAPGDTLDLFLFGDQKLENPPDDVPFIALQRTLQLTGVAPITLATFTREDVNLQVSSAPSDTRFADGPLVFAFRARRGSVVTPVMLLDLDPEPATILDPELDTEAPEVGTLAGSPDTSSFRSDQRDLVLAGTADGELRSVEVTTPLGDNGSVPPVVGSQATGLFLAAPVALGQLATGTTTYQFTARDRALNAASPGAGVFTQLGAVGPGAFTPGDALTVQVFDARTLLPRSGARVMVHSDLGNGTDFPFHAVATSDSLGLALLSTDAGAARVIVTVEASGYDLFTLHGVPSTRLSIPLEPAARAPALASGGVTSDDAAAIALLPGLTRRHDDSRRDLRLPRGFAGTSCVTTAGTFNCLHGDTEVRDLTLGARSFYAGDFTQSEGSFSAAQLLQAFALQVPQPGVPSGVSQPALLALERMLIDPELPDEEAAQALPAFFLRVDPAGGVNLANLDDDPDTEGEPFVTVEARVPGLGGAIAVGPGLAYDQSGGLWRVRAAQPGAVTATGSLGADGAVDPDVHVRAEVVDAAGNASGVRPRLSAIVAGGSEPEFEALDVPRALAPLTNLGSGAFTIELEQVIGDDRSEGGLYRVELEDITGRGWSLWSIDGSGSANVLLRGVDPADGGGTGLADGDILVRGSAFAWEGFDPSAFLWSDLGREFELFSRTSQQTLSKP